METKMGMLFWRRGEINSVGCSNWRSYLSAAHSMWVTTSIVVQCQSAAATLNSVSMVCDCETSDQTNVAIASKFGKSICGRCERKKIVRNSKVRKLCLIRSRPVFAFAFLAFYRLSFVKRSHLKHDISRQ